MDKIDTSINYNDNIEQMSDYSKEEDEEEEHVSFIEYLPENLTLDIENDIYELIDDFIETDPLLYTKHTFHKNILDDVTQTILNAFIEMGLCDEDDMDDMDDVYEFVEKCSDNYFVFNLPRSYQDSFIFKQPNVNIIHEKLEKIRNIIQPKQRTKEWYKFRYNLITASNIGKILSSDAQYNSLIYEKCKPFETSEGINNYVNTESAMHWGNKFEPVSISIYEHKYKTKTGEFGCIKHPQYDCIGASPDGINIEPTSERFGRMIEVKNIVNREINKIPKDAYWVQMQVQMEVCDLDECDFVETRFKEYDNENDMFLDNSQEYRGVILYFVSKTETGSNPYYVYMPLDIPLQKHLVYDWMNEKKQELSLEYSLYNTIYWYLDEFSCLFVPRNRKWFQTAIPKIQDTWNVILKERVSGYDHRMPKKKQNVLLQNTGEPVSNSQPIQYLNFTKKVCLVKLDHGVSLENVVETDTIN